MASVWAGGAWREEGRAEYGRRETKWSREEGWGEGLSEGRRVDKGRWV